MQQVPVEKQNTQSLGGIPEGDNSNNRDQAFDGSFAPWESRDKANNNSQPTSQDEAIPAGMPAQMAYNPSLGGDDISPDDSHSGLKYPRMGTFVARLIAYLIDIVVLSLILSDASYVFYSFILPFFTKSEFLSTSNRNNLLHPEEIDIPVFSLDEFIASQGFSYIMNVGIVVVLTFFVSYLYFGWFEVNKGSSIGKMIMRLKVVRAQDYTYVTWGQAFARLFIGRVVSKTIFFMGYIWYFMSKDRQTWHDLIAQTYVVKVDNKGRILMDGVEKYERKPLAFVLLLIPSIIIMLAGVAGISIFQTHQSRILDSVDAEVYQDMSEFKVALNAYYAGRNSYPWENSTSGAIPSRSGTSGVALAIWQKGHPTIRPWIAGTPSSLVSNGVLSPKFKNSPSATKIKIWSDRKDQYLLCFRPEGKRSYVPTYSEYGVYVGKRDSSAVMYCEEGGKL